jgi:hypothetical protein
MAAAAVIVAQQPPVPQPFPQPVQPGRAAPPTPPAKPPAAQALPPETSKVPAQSPCNNPAGLGVPVYPAAQLLASYDAGQGQYYCLFGSLAGFVELVTYYRNVLKDRGELVFDTPPTHMFEVGRYREEDVAFPPGVTIKDYTWNGSAGYPNPTPNAIPARFRSVIQIVPPPKK